MLSSTVGLTVKNDFEHRTERRKNDEDIAERISGGVRLERTSRERENVQADHPSPHKTSQHKPRRRAR